MSSTQTYFLPSQSHYSHSLILDTNLNFSPHQTAQIENSSKAKKRSHPGPKAAVKPRNLPSPPDAKRSCGTLKPNALLPNAFFHSIPTARRHRFNFRRRVGNCGTHARDSCHLKSNPALDYGEWKEESLVWLFDLFFTEIVTFPQSVILNKLCSSFQPKSDRPLRPSCEKLTSRMRKLSGRFLLEEIIKPNGK